MLNVISSVSESQATPSILHLESGKARSENSLSASLQFEAYL